MGDREHIEENRGEQAPAPGVMRGAPTGGERPGRLDDERAQLLGEQDCEDFRSRWESIQSEFVDEPRRSVEDANRLVSEVTERVVEGFKSQRGDLEKKWSEGGDVGTEDLRVALKRYRAFFDRLLKL